MLYQKDALNNVSRTAKEDNFFMKMAETPKDAS